MTLRLDDRWIWDFWFARDGADYHIYFLEAPRSLGDPELRHWHASIGHAVSRDLRNWDYRGVCLRPSAAPAWDDGTTWTGSIIRHDGRWHMFYTGTSKADQRKKQRIGVVTSSDLHHWQRSEPGPVIRFDADIYEEYSPDHWHDRAFRDPWVMADPDGDGFRMWFTARRRDGLPDGRGVIGTARSADLRTWSIEPPVTPAGDFGECEVPQFWQHGGRRYLLFCTTADRTSAARRAYLAAGGRTAESGTHYYVSDETAAWTLADGPFFAGASAGSLYAGRIIDGPDGAPVFLGTIGRRADGSYLGAVSDPIPVSIDGNGALRLEGAGAATAEARHG